MRGTSWSRSGRATSLRPRRFPRWLQRTGRNGEVLPIGNRALGWEVRVRPRSDPLVSIVIPTAGKVVSHEGRQLDLVTNCVSQICERSTHRNFEIILVDNGDISEER